jgi:hypothetical protein
MSRIELISPKRVFIIATRLGGSLRTAIEHDPCNKKCLDGSGPTGLKTTLRSRCGRSHNPAHVAALQPIAEHAARRRVLVPVPVPVVPLSVPVPDATGDQ